MKKDKFDTENPYSPPVKSSQHTSVPVPIGVAGAYVRQVKPLCICMIIQGALEMIVGIGWIGLGLAVPALVDQQAIEAAGGRGPSPEQVRTILLLTYSVFGAVAVIAGLLRLIAGIRGLYFRGYALGIVSHFFGLLNIATCYCLPTSFALCIWGCIVYLNAEAKLAFRMGAEGENASVIEEKMSGHVRY